MLSEAAAGAPGCPHKKPEKRIQATGNHAEWEHSEAASLGSKFTEVTPTAKNKYVFPFSCCLCCQPCAKPHPVSLDDITHYGLTYLSQGLKQVPKLCKLRRVQCLLLLRARPITRSSRTFREWQDLFRSHKFVKRIFFIGELWGKFILIEPQQFQTWIQIQEN